MKKFSTLFIALLFVFSLKSALAFELPVNTVFKPPMIYGVYEEEAYVIPDSDPGSLQASSITFNPFDIFLSVGKIQNVIFEHKDVILEAKQKLWHLPKDPSVVTLAYWNSLTEDQQKILHYYRNEYQGDLPKIEKEAGESGNMIKSILKAGTHNLAGATGNKDYRGFGERTGNQAIYDKNGDLVLTPENMGTYDFGTPLTLDHYIMDIEPWLIYGNCPEDTTTYEERLEAFGRIYMLYYNYQIIKQYE